MMSVKDVLEARAEDRDVHGVALERLDLSGLDLSGVRFVDVELAECVFVEANLTAATRAPGCSRPCAIPATRGSTRTAATG